MRSPGAALVRSKYPDLSATAVVHRITATAHNGARDPSNVVGAGGTAIGLAAGPG
ncbi:hypothetical protein MAHJHV55_52040 [Mycobacterium avium subsp. hominissuis]